MTVWRRRRPSPLTVSLGLTAIGLLMLAEVARLPYLWEIPRFTDETAEAELGLMISRGLRAPLTNRDPYIGALWNYLVAAGFSLTGPNLYMPRLLVGILGVLTVIPTWLLARSAVGRLTGGLASAVAQRRVHTAGLLAGVFLALAPAHIAVNSHIGWSNCITPLFTTLALWLTHRAIQQQRPQLLPWSGLVWGLAFQTHPVAVLFAPGVALSLALMRPAWLRGKWPVLAVLGAVLGSANLLLANVLDGAKGIVFGGAVQAQYTGGEILTWAVYLDRLRQALWLLSDSLGGILVESGSLSGPLVQPAGLAILLVAACGIEGITRRRDPLLLLSMVSYMLLLPVINGRYESLVPKARYIAPLLPIVFVGVGLALAQLFGWAERTAAGGTDRAPAPSRPPSVPRGLLAPLLSLSVAALTVGLLLVPLSGLVAYYTAAERAGRTNAMFFQATRAVEASRRAGDKVYAERGVQIVYTLGGGQWHEHLAFAASVYGWSPQTFEVPNVNAQTVRRVVGPVLVRTGNVPLVGKSYRIEPIPESPSGASPLRVIYSRGPLPQLVTAERQDTRDDVPQPPRPPRVEPFVEGVSYPSALQFAPDGRLFFNEVLEARVRIASPSGQLQPEPFVSLPTTRGMGQGALGLALDPEFIRNHWVYVFYSEADGANRPVRNRLVRFTERNGLATEPTILLGDLPISQTSAVGNVRGGGNNGGRIVFGPDHKLYISMGEMVRRSLVTDPSTLVGKILRVNRDGTVPSDNPYPLLPTFALGFRDAYGLAFHPVTGQLYATDSGPDGEDELNLVLAGHNYGYPTIEGGAGQVPGLDDPFWDSGEEHLGITGLTIYTGSVFPEYNGDLFFCAFTTGALRRVRLTGPALDQVDWVETIARDCRLDVTTGPDGTLYFSDLERVFRLAR